jgi:hypothetical protein
VTNAPLQFLSSLSLSLALSHTLSHTLSLSHARALSLSLTHTQDHLQREEHGHTGHAPLQLRLFVRVPVRGLIRLHYDYDLPEGAETVQAQCARDFSAVRVHLRAFACKV